MNNWKDFYEIRVNSTYQQYFEKRYEPMLSVIKHFNPQCVREEGIGIGSVSKALRKDKIDTYGFDNDYGILELCRKNNPDVFLYHDCIINTDCFAYSKIKTDLVITHGVLEHFNDDEIISIIARHRSESVNSVHYVPLNKYTTQSFGDERLLPAEHWLELIKPKHHLIFNDGHDLLLIN